MVPAEDESGRDAQDDDRGRDLEGLLDAGGRQDTGGADASDAALTDGAADSGTGPDVSDDVVPGPDVGSEDVRYDVLQPDVQVEDTRVEVDGDDEGPAAYCGTCTTDTGCGAPARVRCTGLGLTNQVCLPVCIRDADCPSQARCVTVTDGRGTAQVCAPQQLSDCGSVACAPERSDCNNDGRDGCEVDLYAAPRCGECAVPTPAAAVHVARHSWWTVAR